MSHAKPIDKLPHWSKTGNNNTTTHTSVLNPAQAKTLPKSSFACRSFYSLESRTLDNRKRLVRFNSIQQKI